MAILGIGLAACAGPFFVAARAAAQPPGEAPAAPPFDARTLRAILRLSPLPPPPPDRSNRFADDPAAASFGRRLFFDPRLSRTGTLSCASCHDPARGWANGEQVVSTDAPFPRNVPSLRNVAYSRWYTWDGRADSSWAQALMPLENDREMGTSRLALLDLFGRDESLRSGYREIFGPLPPGAGDGSLPAEGRPMPESPDHPLHRAWAGIGDEDREAVDRFFVNLGKAIAAFERTLRSGEAPFDRYAAGLRKGRPGKEISPAAQRGLALFAGRGGCSVCHSGPNFTDGEFHDIGIALGHGQRIDPGRHRGVFTLLRSPFTRDGRFADLREADAPVRFLEPMTHQVGQFKTPSLRGVAETAPYMHDGRLATLEEVVRFYSTRQGASPLGHPTTLLQPLGLTENEIADLAEFLRSLSSIGD